MSAPAMDIERRAANYLQGKRYWSWSEDNQKELDAWLAESLEHRVAYWRLEAGLGQAERFAVLKPATPRRAQQSTRRILPLLFGAAAAIAAIAVSVFGIPSFSDESLRTYATTVGGRETLALADGSRIELNTDTVVRLASTAKRRELYLDKGEAYFEIEHDVKRPFIVHVGDHVVTDLGTKFLIRRDEGRLEVAVVEGRVQLDATNGSTKSRLLTKGDVIVATAGNIEAHKKPLATLTDELGWQHGLLVFDHTSLADAATEFNRYNSRKLIVADAKTARLTIDGKFQANNVELFARVARDVLKLKVEMRGADTVVSAR